MRLADILASIADNRAVYLHDEEIDAQNGASVLRDFDPVKPVRMLHCSVTGELSLGGRYVSTIVGSGDRFTFVHGMSPTDRATVPAGDVAQAMLNGETIVLCNAHVVGDLLVGRSDPSILPVTGGLYCEHTALAGRIALSQIDFSCPVKLLKAAVEGHVSLRQVVFRDILTVLP